jgi:hypothetical protein
MDASHYFFDNLRRAANKHRKDVIERWFRVKRTMVRAHRRRDTVSNRAEEKQKKGIAVMHSINSPHVALIQSTRSRSVVCVFFVRCPTHHFKGRRPITFYSPEHNRRIAGVREDSSATEDLQYAVSLFASMERNSWGTSWGIFSRLFVSVAVSVMLLLR